jgi:hypothetical protein
LRKAARRKSNVNKIFLVLCSGISRTFGYKFRKNGKTPRKCDKTDVYNKKNLKEDLSSQHFGIFTISSVPKLPKPTDRKSHFQLAGKV